MWLNRESAWRIKRCSRKRPFHNGTPPAHPFRFRLYLQCQRASAEAGRKSCPVRETFVSEPLGLGGRVLRVHRTPVKELFESFFPRRFLEPDQRVNPIFRVFPSEASQACTAETVLRAQDGLKKLIFQMVVRNPKASNGGGYKGIKTCRQAQIINSFPIA
jgi:hypothetical protein